ncbi:receptor-binding tail tip protein [Escherichia phage HildyBeyeler]|uniref:Receptor-binding tail tip protein n=1 Tax=Escherichia phage HildyBeyeler TaxID=2852005 RepID=A0AAE7VT59_9CAUD|nr:receptor-binding tail tip protein [Escherichia phage HildyBeyeler]
MGFFAGKYSDGKTVLSLNKVNGGDINAHKTPNANTIFHSDMPFVLVESTYESALSSAGNGFFVCQMPSDIANLKSNDPGRVILTAVEINGTHRAFLNGTQSQVGQFSAFFEDFASGRAGAELSVTSAFAIGDSLAHGTYTYNSGLGHEESIARQGSGGSLLQASGFLIYRPGGVSAGEAISRAWNLMGFPAGVSTVPLDSNHADYWEPNWQAPIGSAGRGHNWFYVCNSNIRGFAGKKGVLPNNVNVIYKSPAYPEKIYVCRGSTSNLANQSAKKMIVQDNFNVTPTKVIWYVLNLKYSNGGMSVASNPFTGSDIHISPSNFTIKGVSLPNTSYKFINQNAFGNLASRPDMEYVGNNAAYTGVFGDNTARCEIVGSNKGSLWSPVDYGGSKSQISIYKFSAGKQWYVNSNNNTIGNEHGVVWGPSSVPLRLLPNNVASTYIGDDINPSYPGTGNKYVALSTVSLGLPNANSTVILTTEVVAGNLNTAGMPVRTYSGSAWQVQGRRKQSYTAGDGIFHQILTLPPNHLVPFHTTASYSYAQTQASRPDDLTFTRNGFIYTIKNLGNGNVELGVVIHAAEAAAVFLPRLRVTVQRLT